MIRFESFVRISKTRARSMFYPGGSVFAWFKRNVEAGAMSEATASTPSRTGAMATQNYSDMGANQYGCWINLGNSADYAKFVHEGTTGPIFSETTEYLLLGGQSPTGPGYPEFMLAEHVSGQDAQPWLSESMATALRAHRFPATSSAIRRGD